MTPLLSDKEEIKSEPEETIVERVKLNPRKRKKNRNRIKNWNQANIVSFVSTQYNH